ncbi:hypothetical protein SUGI_0450030 [Cryptomeria japonica]|nr:hypothetical protein SUGI_0450030 [Cryptomeria japonica]
MDMNFNNSSPVSYHLPTNGLLIPSGIDGDYHNGNMKSSNEAEEMFWGASNSMMPLIFDYCEPNGSIQWGAIEDQENGLYDESSDEFRMFKFKVVICTKESSHDWTECPFAHRGERARRRPPSLYCGETCPDYKKGYCRKGMTCEFAHGLFETWLHPQRYRTQRCKDGIYCNRRVCFFAHSEGELRCTSDPRSPCKMRKTQQSISPKTVYNSSNSPRSIRYACSSIAFVPQTYGLGLQQESSPRGAAVPRMINSSSYITCPSPSATSVSSGSVQGYKMDCSCDLGDVIAALRNVDLSHHDEFNYSVNKSVLQNHIGGDQCSIESQILHGSRSWLRKYEKIFAWNKERL